MERWHFGTRRYVPHELYRRMRAECGALVLSNVQPHAAVPFLVGARRLGLPTVAHVASWDHTVGKGVIAPFCDVYVVQNEAMREDLARFHGIGSERVVVTGWPQTDIYARQRPREGYESLLRSFGLDPTRPLVVGHGEHARQHAVRGPLRRAHGRVVEGVGRRPSVAPLPSPSARPGVARATSRRARHRGRRRAGGELHRLRGARDAPPALRLRRRERGDDPARRARQRPPLPCASSTTRALLPARATR